ncbi:PAS domain S-box protein [Dyella sp. ASV21]|uniref:PAS domain S-box protein n=1 Tax=Dyella sp. ASV21 TaxID=2795114 RepID=UPI0018EAC986|nr:PAS domain S-box protein [Dyella sp. ASV21]
MNAEPAPDIQPDLFEALFNTAPDAMIVVDHEGQIVLTNPQAEIMFGYGRHELLGQPIEVLLPERVRLAHQSHRAQYMGSPRVRPMGAGYELTGVRRDGSPFPVEIGLSPIRTGGDVLFAASIRDISETQRARQALVRARYDAAAGQVSRLLLESPSYEMAVDNMPSLIATALNVGAAAILFRDVHGGGWKCRASTGIARAVQKIVCKDLVESRWGADAQRLEFGGTGIEGMPPEFACTRAALVDGLFKDAALVPLPDRRESMGLLLVLAREEGSFDHDKMHFLQSVANMLAAAVQRSRSEEQLAHAQRLDAIGQLTGGIAHDFNNMLTVISGNLQLLDATAPDDALTREALESASRATDRCAGLTSKLLSFASRRPLSPRPTRPTQLLAELREMLGTTLGERIVVSATCPDALPAIDVDPSEFDAALVNLAVNARDAMPRGGRLDITVRGEEASESVDAERRAQVVFRIQDTGLGMSPEVLAHALEPFFTTKDAGKGSGLGLSMVYGFMRQSGGYMTIDSQLGYGTVVELFFPATASSPSEPESEAAPMLRVGHETILVVEDEPEVRHLAVRFLRSLGYATLEAGGAEEALRMLGERPDIDLLFSDIVLGRGMTGVDLAESARRQHPHLPVLLTSGYERISSDMDGTALKRFALLPKPYRKEGLARAIHHALEASHAPG